MSLFQAKLMAVFSVVYAGINVHQFTSAYDAVQEKAQLFAEIAGTEGVSWRLRLVRALFYLAAPLVYLFTMIGAGLPGSFLVVAGIKFWMSSFTGLRTERRLLRGEGYSPRDHALARFDALLNVALACGAIWLVLRVWM